MFNLQIKIDSNAADFLAKIRSTIDGIKQEIANGLQASVKLIRGEAQYYTPVLTGKLMNSYKTVVWADKVAQYGKVYSTAEYCKSVEFGRRPGIPPPYSALGFWSERRLGDGGLAFSVSRGIGRTGTKGAFMFAKAIRASNNNLNSIWRQTVESIIRLQKKG